MYSLFNFSSMRGVFHQHFSIQSNHVSSGSSKSFVMKIQKGVKMSAPMEGVAPVRVKLLFNNLPLESSWVLVKTKKYSRVKEFLDYIKRKFIPKTDGSLTIHINGCKVPEWEKSCIFREDDVVQLYLNEVAYSSNR